MKVFQYNVVDSTQETAKQLVKSGELGLEQLALGAVVMADKQNSGRGTKGRRWFSPPGGLYATYIHRLDCNLLASDIDLLAFTAELTQKVAASIISSTQVYLDQIYSGFCLDSSAALQNDGACTFQNDGACRLQNDTTQLRLKPINDIYYQDCKLAGVLIESLNNLESSVLLVGFGMNIEKLDPDLSAEFITDDKKIISLQDLVSDRLFAELDKHEFCSLICSDLNLLLKK